MISFGVPAEKILSKYSKELYDEAVKQMPRPDEEPKEM